MLINWKVFAQPPRQGTYHKKMGNLKCQDKYEIKENDDIIVATLSDGLGSLEHSDIAATAVTTAISSYLFNYDYQNLKEENLKSEILSECKNAIKRCSNLPDISIAKMDCTLLFVILLKKLSKLIYGQLGDGAIIGVKQNQGVLLSDFDNNAKVSSNMTKTILSSDAIDYFNIKVEYVNDFVGFFLTTDGLQDEIYSRVCKVKKKTEWYFNLISNYSCKSCIKEIGKRWDSLTSKEMFGFTDDMSLVAIVQKKFNIILPDEPTWLCVCMHRNKLESSLCENCRSDFLKIYKGIDFKQIGGKLNYFTSLNKVPENEYKIIFEKSPYYNKYMGKSVGRTHQPNFPPSELSSGKSVHNQNFFAKLGLSFVHFFKKQNHTKDNIVLKKFIRKIKRACNATNFGCLLILSLIYGITTHCLLGASIKNESDLLFELNRLQNENETLKLLNNSIFNGDEMLDVKEFELEETINKIIRNSEKYYFSNGDIFIGQINNGLPNGIGVVYSADAIIIGYFQNGIKKGKFLFWYADGHSEIHMY